MPPSYDRFPSRGFPGARVPYNSLGGFRVIRSCRRLGLSSLLVVLAVLPAAAQDRWEKDIAAFEAADLTAPPPKGEILFVGSSTIRLWDLKASFPDLKTI